MLESMETNQRLAAVLAADVAGYTRLMRDDPAATVAALDEARAVFRAEVGREHGYVVDTAGDSVLAVFTTATGAARAALAIQHVLAAAADRVAEERRMRFRIGLHLGELIEKADGTVYGDGVNLAARLQGLAAPGGICISAVIAEQITGRVQASFEDIGRHTLKNVAAPVHVFAWGGTAVGRPAAAETRPVVALGEFAASGSEAVDLANAVRDGIATALSNQTGILVAADPATAHFVVNASVQTAGGRYRATLSLLDRRNGHQFGADRFEGVLDDPFAAQDDLTYRAYNAVRFALHAREMERVRAEPVAKDADTNSLLLRAGSLMFRSDGTGYAEARELLKHVLDREPQNFMALTMQAHAHLSEFVCGYRAVPEADGVVARTLARRAAQINDASDYLHFVLSEIALCVTCDPATAAAEARRSLELNPYYAFATTMLGAALIAAGDFTEGIALCEKTLASEPRLQFAGWVLQFAAFGHYGLGDLPRAIEWAQRAERRNPEQLRALLLLAAAHALTGELDNARAAAQRLLALCPDFRVADCAPFPFGDRALSNRLCDGLRQAGLP
jgi:adenylate cyclase